MDTRILEEGMTMILKCWPSQKTMDISASQSVCVRHTHRDEGRGGGSRAT